MLKIGKIILNLFIFTILDQRFSAALGPIFENNAYFSIYFSSLPHWYIFTSCDPVWNLLSHLSVHKVKSIRETFIAKLVQVMEDNLVKEEPEPKQFFEEPAASANTIIDLPKIPEEENGIDDSGISDSKLML